jgi:exonuclease III
MQGALAYSRGIQETGELLAEQDWDIAALSETKLSPRQAKKGNIQNATRDYARFHACAAPDNDALASSKRGVTLLIKQELLHDHRNHLPESQGKVPRGTVVHVSCM